MNIIFLMLFFFIVESKYTTNYFIKTPFQNKKKLLNFITSSNFFNKYLKNINAEQIEFDPNIDYKKNINNDQKITYVYKPTISLLPTLFLKKVKITHNWKLINNNFIGTIHSNYISFKLKIYSIYENNDVLLMFDAEVLKKKFFIPNIALKYALMDFCDILNNIMHQK